MSIVKLIVGVILNITIFWIMLFLPAGTLKWWRAWALIGVVLVGTIATMVSLSDSKDLLNERFKPPIQQGQPLADKVLVLLLLVALVGLFIFISLDVFHFHLLSKPGVIVSALGLVLVVAGWWLMTLALKENAFAAPVVKHQEERRQTVIDTGVYGIVRHPMYAGAVLWLVGLPLWLESYAAAVFASVPSGILVLRILVEEQFLRRKLNGYDAYMERVRYRLFPFLW
jgi:protein-S-isoprenylcysteine O-methyltransferase Ste14